MKWKASRSGSRSLRSRLHIALCVERSPGKSVFGAGGQINITCYQQRATIGQRYAGLEPVTPHSARTDPPGFEARHVKPHLPRIALRRSFWLIRHADDRASRRLSLLADALAQGIRAEVARLEALVSASGDAQT